MILTCIDWQQIISEPESTKIPIGINLELTYRNSYEFIYLIITKGSNLIPRCSYLGLSGKRILLWDSTPENSYYGPEIVLTKDSSQLLIPTASMPKHLYALALLQKQIY